ncbi:MAG TPA: hypothetical protein DDY24_10180 [Alcaligenaceae bacterium]|nr:hypothetical protein [Alcaligenaceae bacterium]
MITRLIGQISSFFRPAFGAVLAGVLILSGCAGGDRLVSGVNQSAGQQSKSGQTSLGVISSIRKISLHEDRASEAAARSPDVDGKSVIPPSHVSSPNYVSQGKTLSMVGHVVLSSLAGDNTDDQPYSTDGQELTIKLDSGGTRVVVQPLNPALQLNQRVKIITVAGEPTRVQSD